MLKTVKVPWLNVCISTSEDPSDRVCGPQYLKQGYLGGWTVREDLPDIDLGGRSGSGDVPVFGVQFLSPGG